VADTKVSTCPLCHADRQPRLMAWEVESDDGVHMTNSHIAEAIKATKATGPSNPNSPRRFSVMAQCKADVMPTSAAPDASKTQDPCLESSRRVSVTGLALSHIASSRGIPITYSENAGGRLPSLFFGAGDHVNLVFGDESRRGCSARSTAMPARSLANRYMPRRQPRRGTKRGRVLFTTEVCASPRASDREPSLYQWVTDPRDNVEVKSRPPGGGSAMSSEAGVMISNL